MEMLACAGENKLLESTSFQSFTLHPQGSYIPPLYNGENTNLLPGILQGLNDRTGVQPLCSRQTLPWFGVLSPHSVPCRTVHLALAFLLDDWNQGTPDPLPQAQQAYKGVLGQQGFSLGRWQLASASGHVLVQEPCMCWGYRIQTMSITGSSWAGIGEWNRYGENQRCERLDLAAHCLCPDLPGAWCFTFLGNPFFNKILFLTAIKQIRKELWAGTCI